MGSRRAGLTRNDLGMRLENAQVYEVLAQA
jgi:hypothetical protein